MAVRTSHSKYRYLYVYGNRIEEIAHRLDTRHVDMRKCAVSYILHPNLTTPAIVVTFVSIYKLFQIRVFIL
jgi:hypothetical protein